MWLNMVCRDRMIAAWTASKQRSGQRRCKPGTLAGSGLRQGSYHCPTNAQSPSDHGPDIPTVTVRRNEDDA